MPVTPPTDEDLARIADHYGFHVTEPDLLSFQALASGLLVSYDEVERLHKKTRQAAPQRRYQWPAEGTNDLGAPWEECIAASTGMLANTAPFDVSGHPATSVPAG